MEHANLGYNSKGEGPQERSPLQQSHASYTNQCIHIYRYTPCFCSWRTYRHLRTSAPFNPPIFCFFTAPRSRHSGEGGHNKEIPIIQQDIRRTVWTGFGRCSLKSLCLTSLSACVQGAPGTQHQLPSGRSSRKQFCGPAGHRDLAFGGLAVIR